MEWIRKILLALLLALLFVPGLRAQSIKLRCSVRDALGPLAGAVVQVKGADNGAVTDLDGNAELYGVPESGVVVVTMLGYVTEEVPVGGRSEISVLLKEDSEVLDEVVVIGYGTAKRKDYTGSVTSVRLENSPIALAGNSNALESVKGNVAGLDIGATNSAGGQPSMQLRGQKSISGGNAPLIVLDGVLFCGGINDISPNDIASIDVLKDASSAAAFGSRSANGVLIITTKKGTSSKPLISFNASSAVQTWANKPQMKSGDAYVASVLARNDTEDFSWMSPQEYANYFAGNETDWLDYATRIGLKQDYQISVSGAAPKVNYYISSAYASNNGIVKGDDFSRVSLLGKLSSEVTSWLTLSVDAAYTRQDYSGIAANIQTAYYLSPYGTPWRDGSTELEKYPMTESDGLQNPLWQADDTRRQEKDLSHNYRLNASILLKAPWVEGLTFRASYSLNDTRREASDFRKESYFVREGAFDDASRYSASEYLSLLTNAAGSVSNEVKHTNVLDFILNYTKEIGRHSVDATLVSTRDFSTYDKQVMSGSDFAANGNTSLGISGLHKATEQTINYDGTATNNVGYLARVMYSYDDRYSFTASYRRDGSSVFGTDHKWGNFYSVGAAWNPTNEAFYPASARRILSALKLKVSWGKNGNQAIAAFSTLSPVTNGQSSGIRYEFEGSEIHYGMGVSSLGNPELGWESTSALNAGLESSWLGGRLDFDVDAYYSQTKDQIFTRKIPVMTGYSTMKSSMGQVDNVGVEATLRSVNVRSGLFRWSSGLTFWLNRNKLVHLYGEDLDGDGREDDDVSNSLFIGKSLGAIYGYAQCGIVQKDDVDYIGIYSAKPGNPKYMDFNHDDAITAEDRTILGYSSPSFRLNLSNTFQYGNFELYAMITGVFGGNGYYLRSNPNAFRVNGFGYATCNVIDIQWWSDDNPTDIYPAASFSSDGRFIGLQDRTFVRLQDVSLSYNFRSELLRRAGISKLMVFVSGKNLLTLTNWVGDDPETGSTVLSATMPVARSVNVGVNLSF